VDAALERYPRIGQLLVSEDRTMALFQCVTSADTLLTAAGELSAELEATELEGPLEVRVGGLPLYYRNLDALLLSSFPLAIGFVVLATILLLFAAFRSILMPIKAVVMNLFSVSAGYGVVVAVFQLGWLGALVGQEHPLDSVPLTIPILLFCITFGISMDYEVFMLSRMKKVFDQTGDNRTATIEGMVSTGPLITNAAAVMVVVFGAFVMADAVLVQMLGLGLAVAVFVDATVIRIFLVPACMTVAGRWNWYPGVRTRRRILIGGRR
jgi:RND superfamily putative drug exporter